MSMYYALDGHGGVREIDTSTKKRLFEWAKSFEETDRVVAKDRVGGYLVSTVFLGIDHRFGNERSPLLFETMVFRGAGKYEGYQERHSTNSQAVKRHYAIVREIGESMTFFGRIRNFITNVVKTLRI